MSDSCEGISLSQIKSLKKMAPKYMETQLNIWQELRVSLLIFLRAAVLVLSGESIAPTIVTYNTLLGAYASCGRHTEALKVFGLLVEAGFEPDVVSYTSLLNAYGKSGHLEKAQEVFDLMKKRSRRPNLITFNSLVDAYAAAGKYNQARELLHDMAEAGVEPNVVTICSLFTACAQGRCPEKVADVFHEAKVRNIKLNVNAFNASIQAYLDSRLWNEAMELLKLMELQGVEPDGVTFSSLISASGKSGDYKDARNFYDKMIDMGVALSVEPCSALIHAYAIQVCKSCELESIVESWNPSHMRELVAQNSK